MTPIYKIGKTLCKVNSKFLRPVKKPTTLKQYRLVKTEIETPLASPQCHAGRQSLGGKRDFYPPEKSHWDVCISVRAFNRPCFSTFNARAECKNCRRHFKNLTNKNKIRNCLIIWNQREKCSQLSTNMPGIGLVFREKSLKHWDFENI